MPNNWSFPINTTDRWSPPMRPIRTSAKALVLRDGHLLLVRRKRELGIDYVLPGGGQQMGEDLHSAVIRECREETGAIVEVGELRFVREYIGRNHGRSHTDGDFHQVEIWFECKYIGQSPDEANKTEDYWQDGVEWVPVSNLHRLTTDPEILGDILRGGHLQWPTIYLGDRP